MIFKISGGWNGKRHDWIEVFVKNRGIRTLTRNVVVELIEQVKVYEDRRIEVRFRYAEALEHAGESGPAVQREVS